MAWMRPFRLLIDVIGHLESCRMIFFATERLVGACVPIFWKPAKVNAALKIHRLRVEYL
jgi:hypothetical protein